MTKPLVAAVDVGNTRIHVCLFRGDRPISPVSFSGSETSRVNAHLRRADAVLLCSVNPKADRRLRHPRLLRMGTDFPPLVSVTVPRPREIGMDRLANTSAAWNRMRRACVVVDVGTAVTFDVVDNRGRFVGGLIAPGLSLGAEALNSRTALLPRVKPVRVLRARQTRTRRAIEAGLYWSVAGLIEAGLRDLRREFGRRLPALGTGGDAPLFTSLFDTIIPTLTLEGIHVSYEHHRRSSDPAGRRRDRRS